MCAACPAAPGCAHRPGRSVLSLAGFAACASLLGPYLLEVGVVEREMFGRGWVLLPTALYLAALFHAYVGARGFLAPGRHRAAKLAGLAVLAGAGRIGLLAIAGVLLAFVACEAGARLAADRLPARWWRPAAVRGVAIALLVAAFPLANAVTLFGIYRSFEPPRLLAHPLFETHAAGLRGPALEPGPNPPALRLLFLGDSATFGFPYASAVAYPARVGRLLREQVERPVEVLNAGIPGQSLVHLVGRLDSLLATGPELVFLMVGVHYPRALGHARAAREGRAGRTWPATLTRFLPPSSMMLFAGYASHFMDWDEEVPGRLGAYRQALDALVARVQASGARLVVLEHPSPEVEDVVQALLRGVGARDDVAWIGLSHLFDDPGDYALRDDIHPTAERHGAIADAVVQALRADPDLAGLLRPPAGSPRGADAQPAARSSSLGK